MFVITTLLAVHGVARLLRVLFGPDSVFTKMPQSAAEFSTALSAVLRQFINYDFSYSTTWIEHQSGLMALAIASPVIIAIAVIMWRYGVSRLIAVVLHRTARTV